LNQLDDDDDDLTQEIEEKLNNQSIDDLENELSQFRFQWKQELLVQQRQEEEEGTLPTTKQSVDDADVFNNLQIQNEKKAAYLFSKGVLLEQQGRLYEAIKFYRMAMQLDADVESKLATNRQQQPQQQKNEVLTNQDFNTTSSSKDADSSLLEQFQIIIDNDNRLCEKHYSQKGSHFSSLPLEVVIYILKWVVSEDLDLRSLDTVANVNKLKLININFTIFSRKNILF
jgi:F-box protein 9